MIRFIVVLGAGLILSSCAVAPKPPSCSGEALRPLSSTPKAVANQVSDLAIADSYLCGGA